MKPTPKAAIVIGLAALSLLPVFAGQGLITLVDGDSVAVASNEVATVKTIYPYGGAGITIAHGTNTYTQGTNTYILSGGIWKDAIRNLVIAGPATISGVDLLTDILTLDIQPMPTPPQKTAVVAAHSGHVKVTMEDSTDLVNWAPVPDGAVYTSSPDVRFLRIKMEKVSNP